MSQQLLIPDTTSSLLHDLLTPNSVQIPYLCRYEHKQ